MRLRTPLQAATGGIFFIGLALAIAISNQFGDNWFIVILFITLACTSFIGSLNFNRRGVYSGSYGFVWLLAIALFFLTNSWLWFLVAIGATAILSALWRPMMRGNWGAYSGRQQPYYQPTYQPPPTEPTYQPYEQGYQPPPQSSTYQEGGMQHPYPQSPQPQEPQYEQPQVQYPQEMPPPQQG